MNRRKPYKAIARRTSEPIYGAGALLISERKMPKFMRVLFAVSGILVILASSMIFSRATSTSAAPSQTLTFQARILTAPGALVPDGNYNVQFNLYDVALGGTSLWTETYLNQVAGNDITIKNGYLYANLGTITSFPSTINWDQELWLTLNIGNTNVSCTPFSSCSPDGEMTPRFKITATPYAFAAGTLSKTSGSFKTTIDIATPTANRTITAPDASGTICLTSGNCAGVGGTGDILDGGQAGAISVGTTNNTTLTLLQNNTSALTVNASQLLQFNAYNCSTFTNGGALTTDSSGNVVCSNDDGGGGGGSLFTDGGAATYLTATGDTLLVGASTANGGKLEVVSTTEQLRLSYDAANNTTFTVGSSGDLTVTPSGGQLSLAGDLEVTAGNYISLAGGNTASRPGSPTEGMAYFDTTTDSLLTYANGKWQSDRGEYVVVAANDSTQAEKDSADYVADGTADQTEINSALTEAAGGKVILLAGTYVANATILIPNNTTLAGAGTGTVIELADIDLADNLIENSDTSTGTGVVLRDLKLDGRSDLNTVGAQDAIRFVAMGAGSGASARPGAVINNIMIENFSDHGIIFSSSSNNTVSSNIIKNVDWVAIETSSTSNNNLFENNRFIGNTATYGVLADGTENIFQNNYFEDTGDSALYISGDRASVSGNKIRNNNYGLYVAGYFTTIIGNVIEYNVTGVEIVGYTNTNLSSNTINNNSLYGVNVWGEDNLISNNTFNDNGGATTNNAIHIDGGERTSVVGNIITDTSCTTSCYAINITSYIDNKDIYLADNSYYSTAGLDQSTIRDLGTNTRYASQQVAGQTLQSGSTILKANATSVLSGDIDPIASTTVTGVSTKFITELQVGDRITVSGETRTVTAIASDTSLTVDTAFSNNSNDLTPDRLPAALIVKDSSNNTSLVIADNGNIGIGTSAPTERFEIRQANSGSVGLKISQNETFYASFTVDDSASLNDDLNLEVVGNSGTGDYIFTDEGRFGINTGNSAIPLGTLEVYSTSTSLPVAVLRSVTSQTADILQIQNNSSVVLSGFNSAGNLFISDGSSNYGTIAVASTAGDYTYTIPTTTANDTFCLVGLNNCTGAGATSVGALDGGTLNANGGNISAGVLYLQSASATYPGLVTTGSQTLAGAKTFTGSTIFQTATDSTTGFEIRDADGGNPVFRVDTVNERVGIGTATLSAVLSVSGPSNATNLQIGSSGATIQSGTGVSIEGSDISSGRALSISGNNAGEVAAISGALIGVDPVKDYGNAATKNETGNFLYMLRRNTATNASGTFNTSGDLALLQSNNCIGATGTCTDSSNVLSVTQSFTGATGEALLVTNAGTGLSLRINDDGTDTDSTPFVVNNSGNVGIGISAPEEKLQIAGGNILLDNATFIQFKDAGGTKRNVLSVNASDDINIGNSTLDDINFTTTAGTAFTLQKSTGNGILLGDLSVNGGDLRVSDGSSNYGTIAVASTAGDYTYTIPTTTANDTFCLYGLNNCENVGAFIQGGNTFGTTATLGTNDGYGLILETGGSSRLNISSLGVSTFTGRVILAANQSLTLNGGNTASRPGSPTEGMVYFDTDTDRLMTYSNGKWQTDNREAILVAANNSSQADKDAADYVANGNTGAANDGDQIEINNALTTASGRKVVLLAGTYVADATILVPNNTTLAGVGPGTVIELADIDATDNLIENSDTTTGTGVVIRDLKLDGRDDLNTAGTQHGIYLNVVGSTSRAGGSVVSIYAEDFRNSGVRLNASYGNTISNSTISSSVEGVGLYSSDNNVISNNNLQLNDYGLWNDASSDYNTISSNTATPTNTGGPAFFIRGSHNNIIGNTSFTVTGGGGNGISISSSTATDNVISGNSIDGGGYGIIIDNSASNNLISNNIIENADYDGISLAYQASSNNVSGNIIRNSGIDCTTCDGIAVFGGDADYNSIVNNIITDTAGTGSAIDIQNVSNNDNYLSNNNFSGTGATAINNSGTNTIYANQATSAGGLNTTFRQANSTNAFAVQNASGASILTVDTTNSEVELGNSTTAGRLVVSDGSSNTGTILVAATAGDYSYTIPTTTANDTFCLQGLNNCSGLSATLTDNVANAWDIQEGTNNYFNINTTNGSENISFGNATTNPSYSFLGSGVTTFSGDLTLSSSAPSIGSISTDTGAGTCTWGSVQASVYAQDTLGGYAELGATRGACARLNLYSSGSNRTALFFGNGGGSNIGLEFKDTDNNVIASLTDAGTTGNFFLSGNAEIWGGSLTVGTSSVAGNLVVSDGSSNTGTIAVQSTAGNYTYTIPTTTANDTFCLVTLANCAGSASTLQASYTADVDGSDAEILLTVADGALRVRDAASTVGNLFVVEANGGSDYFAVTSTGITLGINTTVAAGQSLTITGGNTASRPGSPTEGMVYFDSTTDSLLTYANGKWQSDRGEFVVVAANDSTQAEKDSADYVADGTADQTEINNALTEAAGGTVILLAGTFTADATILIPNNTTLAGAGPGTVIRLADIDATDNLIETSGASKTGQIIRDLTLDGQDSLNTAGTQYGIYFFSIGSGSGSGARQGGSVINTYIKDFRTSGFYSNASDNNNIVNNIFQGQGGSGIYIPGATENTLISGNRFIGNGGDGLEIVGGSKNTITSNVFEGNGGSGIYYNTGTNVTITGNTSNGNASRGLYLYNLDDSTVSGNSANSNTSRGLEIFSTGTTVTGNTFNGNASNGIYALTVNTTSFIGNTIQNNTSAGIFFNGGGDDNIVSNNTISGNSSGISLTSADRNTISSNNIYDNGGSTTNNGIYLDNSNFNNIVNNTISDSACTTNCYAINLALNTPDKNYLEGNRFTGSTANAASINDTGTNTIYAGQQTNTSTSTASDVSDFRFRGSVNSATALSVQNASGASILNVDTANGELEVGDTTTTGRLVISDGSSNTGTILVAATAGNYTFTIPTVTADDTFCLQGLNNCSGLSGTLTDNTANAWDIQEGTNNYFNINTTNGSENISFGNATTNPSYNFLGTGVLSVESIVAAGSVSIGGNEFSSLVGQGLGFSSGELYVDYSQVDDEFFRQNGNSFGTSAVLGTDDTYSLELETNNLTRLTVEADGDLAVDTNTLFVDATANQVGIGTTSTDAKLTIRHGSATETALTLQVRADQDASTDLFVAKDVGGEKRTWINEKGELRTRAAADNSVAFRVKANSGSQTGHLLQFTDSFNAVLGFVDGEGRYGIGYAPVSNTADAASTLEVQSVSTTNITAILRGFSSAQSADLLRVVNDSTNNNTLFSIGATGDVVLAPDTASAAAFRINYPGGNNIFVVDTLNGQIGTVSTTGASNNSQQLVIRTGAATGTSSDTGDFVFRTGSSSLGASGDIQLEVGGASTTFGDINVGAVYRAGTIRIGQTGTANIQSTVNIATSTQGTQTVSIGSSSTAANTTLIRGGTGASAILLQAGSGGTIGIANNAVAQTVTIGNTTGATAVNILTGSGNFSVDTNTLFVNSGTNRVGFGTSTLTQGAFIIDLPGVDTANGAIAGILGSLSSTTNNLSAFTVGTPITVGSSADRDFAGITSGINTATNNLNTGTASVSGFNAQPTYSGTGNIFNLIGYTTNITNSSTGTVSNVRTFEAANPINAGTITNNTGLYVIDQTAGTNDYGIVVEGADTQALWISSIANTTDAANGIAFGLSRDTNLYRSASDVLRTDDALSIGGTLTVSNITPTANLTIGTSDTTATLFVLDTKTSAGDSGTVNGAMYYNSSDGKFRCYEAGTWKNCITATSGVSKTVKFAPEFAGGTIFPDGTNNSGTLAASFQSGLSAGEGYKHTYYEWSTSQATAQDYTVVVNVQLPSDYASGIGSVSFWHRDPDGATTNGDTTVVVKDVDGTSCASTIFQGATANTWEQETITLGGGCTYAANDYITFEFTLKTTSGAGVIRLGEFQFSYTN